MWTFSSNPRKSLYWFLERICSHATSVTIRWNKKCPIFLKGTQKLATNDFSLKATCLKHSPKSHQILGLLLYENLSPITLKIRLIWLHFMQPTTRYNNEYNEYLDTRNQDPFLLWRPTPFRSNWT